MIIGIFSDSHDNIPNLKQAYQIFQKHQVQQAFFCGDLVSPFTLKFLKDWAFPIKAVFGNNEGDKWGFARRFRKYKITNIEYPERGLYWSGKFAGAKIAVFHGHSPKIVQDIIDSQKYDLFFSGHTHEPHIKTMGKTTWINPGSVTGVSENPKIKGGSVAVYDIENKQGQIVKF